MSDEPSRVEEYRGNSAKLRLMADNTHFPEIRTRLLELAASFERLAREVGKWETEPRVGTAH